MNKRRLLKLADLLEADAKDEKGIQFDLGSWGYGAEVPGIHCGTTACAMGLAALSGAFRHAGLGKEILKFDDGSWELVVRCKGSTGIEAAAVLFDIDCHEASWLFYPDYYADGVPPRGADGERLVAKRIRYFVEECCPL